MSKEMSPEMKADYEKWLAKSKNEDPGSAFVEVKEKLIEQMQQLPDVVEIPYELTPEGKRWVEFKTVCDPMFLAKIDRDKVKCAGFDKIVDWSGDFPGPCATGPTGTGKTFAAWQALRRHYVRHNKAFAWFPVRRLVTEMEKFEKNSAADEFFRTYNFFPILFVDDLDKINWDFESQTQALFSFYDWVYRTKKPVITTTNKDRKWWASKMGDAFARRLFEHACVEVVLR